MKIFVNTNELLSSGAASPQAVKKLLALSEQSKPRQKNTASLERGESVAGAGPRVDRVDRADQPTPVNLTSESSSVSGRPRDAKVVLNSKTKVRKVQNSIGSVTSTDSGFGQGLERLERLERNQSESPQLPPRRRYHQHYHRQHQHGEQS